MINYIKELLAFDALQYTERHLSPMAQLIWYKLISLDNKTRWSQAVHISNAQLSSLCGISLNTLKRARKELETQGYITYVQSSDNIMPSVYVMRYNHASTYNDEEE